MGQELLPHSFYVVGTYVYVASRAVGRRNTTHRGRFVYLSIVRFPHTQHPPKRLHAQKEIFLGHARKYVPIFDGG